MEELKLSKENIQEWKAELGRLMFERYEVDEYEKTVSDEDWLFDYEGETVEYAVSDEVSNWSN